MNNRYWLKFLSRRASKIYWLVVISWIINTWSWSQIPSVRWQARHTLLAIIKWFCSIWTKTVILLLWINRSIIACYRLTTIVCFVIFCTLLTCLANMIHQQRSWIWTILTFSCQWVKILICWAIFAYFL